MQTLDEIKAFLWEHGDIEKAGVIINDIIEDLLTKYPTPLEEIRALLQTPECVDTRLGLAVRLRVEEQTILEKAKSALPKYVTNWKALVSPA